MREPNPDYTLHGLRIAARVLAALVVVAFIPPVTIGGVHLRRANIFADLYAFDDPAEQPAATDGDLFDEADFEVDFEDVERRIDAGLETAPADTDAEKSAPSREAAESNEASLLPDTLPSAAAVSFEWRLGAPAAARREPAIDPRRFAPRLTPIEDFSPDARFAAFCDTLLEADRPVRIAVLGDSFVEGDILTADLRERLQRAFGGRGTGFAPMASPLTAFRRTVRTRSNGWTAYNIMKHKSVPAQLGERFFVSGWVCRPADGASTRWEATDYRSRLDSCSTARVLFIAPRDSRIRLILNDSLHRDFSVAGSPDVRQAVVTAPSIHTLEFRVTEGASDMIGYGALFEQKGVTVDNYSVRSNNGQAIFRTNPAVNAQIDALTGYDLVILQYGLNIMQAGVRSYTQYGAQIEKIITYVRRCFPTAAVLVMGVSDRAVKGEQGIESMDAIPYMLDCQRTAARNCGAAFWSTYDAMRADGGIEEFVARGWAGKDFTHINYAGGRRVGWALYDAINAEAAKAAERRRRRIERAEPLIDSVLRRSLHIAAPAYGAPSPAAPNTAVSNASAPNTAASNVAADAPVSSAAAQPPQAAPDGLPAAPTLRSADPDSDATAVAPAAETPDRLSRQTPRRRTPRRALRRHRAALRAAAPHA